MFLRVYIGSNRANLGPIPEPEAISAILRTLRAEAPDLGATILPGWGVWEGAAERSFVVEFLRTDNEDGFVETVVSFASSVRVALDQTAVLVSNGTRHVTLDATSNLCAIDRSLGA